MLWLAMVGDAAMLQEPSKSFGSDFSCLWRLLWVGCLECKAYTVAARRSFVCDLKPNPVAQNLGLHSLSFRLLWGVAQHKRLLYSKVNHRQDKVAQNYRPWAVEATWLSRLF